MNLRFNQYGIKTLDKYQVVLVEYKKVKNKESKNYGNETETILGYYGDTAIALKHLYRLMVRRSDVKTVEGLLRAFKDAEENISKIVKNCKRKSK